MSRLLFSSTVELLGTESTLGEFHLGEKPNLLQTELEKKKSMQSKKSILQPSVNNSIKRMQLNTLLSVPWHPIKEKAKKYYKQSIKLLTVLAPSLKPQWLLPPGCTAHRPERGSVLLSNCRNLSSCCAVRDCLGCDNLGLTSSFHDSSKIN